MRSPEGRKWCASGPYHNRRNNTLRAWGPHYGGRKTTSMARRDRCITKSVNGVGAHSSRHQCMTTHGASETSSSLRVVCTYMQNTTDNNDEHPPSSQCRHQPWGSSQKRRKKQQKPAASPFAWMPSADPVVPSPRVALGSTALGALRSVVVLCRLRFLRPCRRVVLDGASPPPMVYSRSVCSRLGPVVRYFLVRVRPQRNPNRPVRNYWGESPF